MKNLSDFPLGLSVKKKDKNTRSEIQFDREMWTGDGDFDKAEIDSTERQIS